MLSFHRDACWLLSDKIPSNFPLFPQTVNVSFLSRRETHCNLSKLKLYTSVLTFCSNFASCATFFLCIKFFYNEKEFHYVPNPNRDEQLLRWCSVRRSSLKVLSKLKKMFLRTTDDRHLHIVVLPLNLLRLSPCSHIHRSVRYLYWALNNLSNIEVLWLMTQRTSRNFYRFLAFLWLLSILIKLSIYSVTNPDFTSMIDLVTDKDWHFHFKLNKNQMKTWRRSKSIQNEWKFIPGLWRFEMQCFCGKWRLGWYQIFLLKKSLVDEQKFDLNIR